MKNFLVIAYLINSNHLQTSLMGTVLGLSTSSMGILLDLLTLGLLNAVFQPLLQKIYEENEILIS